ncbi:MAG: 3'-5' exonuclease [Clostridia bacterium]|nr:3'-5' exonuclease [Clostridia bacterium]
MPKGDPSAYTENADGSITYYYDPDQVVEAPVETWYTEDTKKPAETMTLESGTVIEKMTVKKAALFGYYTKERLEQLHYDVVEEPVAYTTRLNHEILYFYDKKTAIKQPMMCAQCGKFVRYKHKLCEACFAKDLAERCRIGDEYRNAHYEMSREKVLFFDLELTGVYDRDEVISISIVDGNGRVIMDTLVKPTHTKKWKRTEKIHGITPDMVQDAPYLSELTPRLKEIFAAADNLIAFGVSTDYSHIKYIYDTEAEREWLKEKTRCCSKEYVRYIQEHYPDLVHASLSDAMECLGIEWTGAAHTSIADTIACGKVWEKLFPNYYAD